MDAASTTAMILSVVQTVGVIGALLFTGYEIHTRRREQRFRNYLDAISGSVDLAKLMVENQDLHALYEYSTEELNKKYEELSPAEKARVHYCDLTIALCETVWVANKQGWLPKDEWPYWKAWVDQLRGSKDFRWTVRWCRDDYDRDFLADLGLSARITDAENKKRIYPSHVVVPVGAGGQTIEGIVLCEQVRTISKTHKGKFEKDIMTRIDAALKIPPDL